MTNAEFFAAEFERLVLADPLDEGAVLAALPGSPADLLHFGLGYTDDGDYRAKHSELVGMLERLCAEGKVYGRSRPADDSWYDRRISKGKV